MAIVFDPISKLIKITSGTEIDALTIYNATMDWVDDQSSMDEDVPLAAVGKNPLGGGVYTDSIFILQNGWKIKLYDGTYQFVIKGTVITDDESPRTVPPDSGNVEVIFQVSSQGIIIPGGEAGVWSESEKDAIISDVTLIKSKVTKPMIIP